MAYVIQAFIGKETMLGSPPKDVYMVDLPQQMRMIPVTRRIRTRFNIPLCPLTDEGMPRIQVPLEIEAFLKKLSPAGSIAYIEAEFFGGVGLQAAITWNSGQMTGRLITEARAINAALQFLGVEKGSHFDEFAALGLGKYRSTEDWVAH